MSTTIYHAPEPETMDSIRLGRMVTGRCGCQVRARGGFFLCDYHEGYDDAIDAMKQRFKVPS